MDVLALSRLIRQHGIHILLNWDGYSNADGRVVGIFPMRPAPLQLGHQVKKGTRLNSSVLLVY